MEDFQMYSKIQQKKLQGFSRDAIARQLELNWRTVDHYWEMTAADYEAQRARQYVIISVRRSRCVNAQCTTMLMK